MSGLCPAAMPRTQVCRNSLLPAPVVPPTRACGPWLAQVEGQRLAGGLPDHRAQAQIPPPDRAPASRFDDGLRFPPPVDHRRRIGRQIGADQGQEGDRPRQVRVVLHAHPGVADRRQRPGRSHGGGGVDGLADHRRDPGSGA